MAEEPKRMSLPMAVFLRPKMYTIGGTFEEVVAFLEGYYSGMAKANPNCPPVPIWGDFVEALRLELGVDQDTFGTLRSSSSSSEEALAKLIGYFNRLSEQQY
jgi:hypothetical protein